MAAFATSASLYDLFVRQLDDRGRPSRSPSVEALATEQSMERRTRWSEDAPAQQGHMNFHLPSAVAAPVANASVPSAIPDQSHWPPSTAFQVEVPVPDDLLRRGGVIGVMIGPKAYRLREWKRQTSATVFVHGTNPYYLHEQAMFPEGSLRALVNAPSVGARDACVRKINEFFDRFRREPAAVKAELHGIRVQQFDEPTVAFSAAPVKVCSECGSNKHSSWEGMDAAKSNASQLTTEAAEYLDALKQISKEIPFIVGMLNTLSNTVKNSGDQEFLRHCVKVVRPKLADTVTAATSIAELGTRLNDMICDKWIEEIMPDKPPIKGEIIVEDDSEERMEEEVEEENTFPAVEEEEEIIPPPPPSLSTASRGAASVSGASSTKQVGIDEKSLQMLSRVVDLLGDQFMMDSLESIKQDALKKKNEKDAEERRRREDEEVRAPSRHKDIDDVRRRGSRPQEVIHDPTRQVSPSPLPAPRLRQEERYDDGWDRSSKRHRSSSRPGESHKRRSSRSPRHPASRHSQRRSSPEEERQTRHRRRSVSPTQRRHEESRRSISHRSPSPNRRRFVESPRRSHDRRPEQELVPLPASRWDDDDDERVGPERFIDRPVDHGRFGELPWN